jgi:indole-3-acetate O-methyltransferase
LVRQAIFGVRARWPRRSLAVSYTDQPRNDYNSLFQLIHGLTPIPSYLDTVDDVYVLATVTSFYRPLVPLDTFDLGFSAAAMHWR